MIIVSNWQDSDINDRDVRSCDNKDLGHIKEVNQSYFIVEKGDALIRIPRSALATFSDGKVYLRATEAEVLSGIYPFLDSENADWQKSQNITTNSTASSQPVTVAQAVPQNT